ncbi:hypothetical protein A3A39_01815 [Candidatus Kaiserbacteria bacterium RIFCSPLOWO2_01_FULL_54_13]|uniref:Uncharacterized protein n=1 Tax=Candidatus Kaiserbacteria bacterium RIFCSPLOWO2_01_FULL_54_13 TaxID=1798512 RepID=A0A1F6F1E8_9BACT|nr:MAG: hypothetical protein A3A39_01815 [Candidatus Kaiserbacteria bacterium RIFCSPLOWO2_01_FULL_54_13]
MLNFNGGTVISGTSIAPLGAYAGYLLLQSGNVAIAVCFLLLTVVYFVIAVSTLCRYIINYYRSKHLLHY